MLICVQKESELRYEAKISFSRDMHTRLRSQWYRKKKQNSIIITIIIKLIGGFAYKAKRKLEIWLKRREKKSSNTENQIKNTRTLAAALFDVQNDVRLARFDFAKLIFGPSANHWST